nr:MAG TPA: hypothetical protein [Crassvirales sp.]
MNPTYRNTMKMIIKKNILIAYNLIKNNRKY